MGFYSPRNSFPGNRQVKKIAISFVTTTVLALCLPLPAWSETSPYPNTIHYSGMAENAQGVPLHGQFSLGFRYLDEVGNKELGREAPRSVNIARGKFGVELGAGKFEDGSSPELYGSLQELSASHAELRLEVIINGTPQSPLVAIVPAGHSLESRLILAGERAPSDDQRHWKHYRDRSAASAL